MFHPIILQLVNEVFPQQRIAMGAVLLSLGWFSHWLLRSLGITDSGRTFFWLSVLLLLGLALGLGLSRLFNFIFISIIFITAHVFLVLGILGKGYRSWLRQRLFQKLQYLKQCHSVGPVEISDKHRLFKNKYSVYIHIYIHIFAVKTCVYANNIYIYIYCQI